jgi:hypothetical protein
LQGLCYHASAFDRHTGRILKRYIAALGVLVLSAAVECAFAAELLSLGPDHFRDTAVVTEDAAHDSTTISTEPGYRESSLGTVWHDEYLQATIDHKTEHKTFEVYGVVTYTGGSRGYQTGTYQGLAGSQTVEATLARRVTANCASGDCVYTDHLAIPVDEQLLRKLAQAYQPGKPTLWTFTLSAKRGRNFRGEISDAEMAGLLARVDNYTPGQAAAAPAPPVVPAPPPAQRLDFGISGLAITPSAEMPQRAGVLVVGINAGSVAQRAGVIAGDIIYDLGGRAIKTPTDLESAIGATAAGSKTVIKVFRGTNEMALSATF